MMELERLRAKPQSPPAEALAARHMHSGTSGRPWRLKAWLSASGRCVNTNNR